MRIRPHQGVGQPNAFFLASNAGQEFKVDLVDNATGWRDGLEIGQRLLAPLEERVALHVTVVFNVEVHVKRIAVSAGNIDLNRVVNHQIHRDLRVDFLGVAAHFHHGVSKSCQVHHGRHAGEVLKDDSGRAEGDLATLAVGCPCGDLANVLLGDEEPVISTQSAFEENADGVGEVSRGNAVGIKGVKCEVIAANAEGLSCVKGVQGRHDSTEKPAVYEENPSPITLVCTTSTTGADNAGSLLTRIGTMAWSLNQRKWPTPIRRLGSVDHSDRSRLPR